MTSSAPNPADRAPRAFEAQVDEAFRDRSLGTLSLPTPLDPEPRTLLRYVSGRTSPDERATVEAWLARSRWAYDRVVALVRAARPGAPPLARALAARLPIAPTAGAAVAAAALEVAGLDPSDLTGALERLREAKPGEPKASRGDKLGGPQATRAAVLLGLGRHDEATRLVGDRDDTPLADLIRSLASSTARDSAQTDHALLLVLDRLPTLLESEA
jgi:hypothetical protein